MKKLFALLFATLLVVSVGCCGSTTSVLEDGCGDQGCQGQDCPVPYQEIER
tara:strand:+ start:3624 stop:3776 length:153 start_codon:yes stop_codon:yes gene_type:complete